MPGWEDIMHVREIRGEEEEEEEEEKEEKGGWMEIEGQGTRLSLLCRARAKRWPGALP